jgi:lipopolysaccharide transport system ATP-binding protein
MKPENAIEIDNVSKVYYVAESVTEARGRSRVLRNLTSPLRRLRATLAGQSAFGAEIPVKALDEVSFEVPQGKILGLIGKNGSGKSTLLKILSRITAPSSGQVRIRGKVGSLLEVGTGFHQELTGRENIYMNGAVLGMTRADINRHFDDIIGFAGVGAFLDTPVKRYSSGMRVRLAFAVSAFFEPEVLLIDEVLSVGDAEFQKRSLGKISDVSRDGRTVVIVSHNLSAILSHCDLVAWLNKGKLASVGNTAQITSEYLLSSTFESDTLAGEKRFRDFVPSDKYPFELLAMRTYDDQQHVRSSFLNGMPVVVELEFKLGAPIPHLNIGFVLKSSDEQALFSSFHNDQTEVVHYDPQREVYRVRGVIPPYLLNSGSYYIDPIVQIHRKDVLISDVRGLSIDVTFDVPNTEYVMRKKERRPGVLAPILEWQDASVAETKPE